MRRAAAIGVERQFAAEGGIMLGDESASLAARQKVQILEANRARAHVAAVFAGL